MTGASASLGESKKDIFALYVLELTEFAALKNAEFIGLLASLMAEHYTLKGCYMGPIILSMIIITLCR